MIYISQSKHKVFATAPQRPKKITGTRLAAVLGMSPYATPFEAWAAMTRIYEKPYEETIYTAAGNAAEPKQIEYLKSIYPKKIITPTDKYGPDPFKKTYGDFFQNKAIYGGMWDSLVIGNNDKTETVIECKTHGVDSKSWEDGVPVYYKLQAALYAALLQTDQMIFVDTTLTQTDYEHPENIMINKDNTKIIGMRVTEEFPNWTEMIQEATSFFKVYVMGGTSPEFDPVRDKEILEGIRMTHPDVMDVE